MALGQLRGIMVMPLGCASIVQNNAQRSTLALDIYAAISHNAEFPA